MQVKCRGKFAYKRKQLNSKKLIKVVTTDEKYQYGRIFRSDEVLGKNVQDKGRRIRALYGVPGSLYILRILIMSIRSKRKPGRRPL